MTKFERKEYNRQFYLKNKERILRRYKEKTRAKGSNIITLSPNRLLKPHSASANQTTPVHRIETIVLGIFSLIMSGYLIYASSQFYVNQEGGLVESIVKAFIAEGVVLVFSYLEGRSRWERYIYNLVAFTGAIFCIISISSGSVKGTLDINGKANHRLSLLMTLESSLSQQLEAQNRYIKLDRMTIARKYDTAIQGLQNDIHLVQKELETLGTKTSNFSILFALILFRIIVVFSNSLCLKRLKQNLKIGFSNMTT